MVSGLIKRLALGACFAAALAAQAFAQVYSPTPGPQAVPGAALNAPNVFTQPQTIALGTITTNIKGLNLTATWNAAGTTFDAPLFMNITNTASNAASLLEDVQVGGNSFRSTAVNGTEINGRFGASGFYAQKFDASAGTLTWSRSSDGASVGGVNVGSNSFTIGTFQASSQFNISADTILTRKAAANWQFGAADAASPVAQKVSFQGVSNGTSNTSGQTGNIIGSLSTGSGTSGDVCIQTGGTGAGATTPNTAVTGFCVKGATQLVTLPAITSDATHTDATVCEDTTTHALYAGSGTLGVCLGTSSARYKRDIKPLPVGLTQLMAVKPVQYFYRQGHGDNGARLQYGVTAENMAKAIPALASNDVDGRPNTADLVGLVPVLVKAVQEQQAEIEALQRQVVSLRRVQ